MHRIRVSKKYYTYEQLLGKAMKYCARCETSEMQVVNKMIRWGALPVDREKIIKQLIEQNFVNDKRFAQAFVNDKLKFKGWGKKKITAHLLAKGVSKEIISQAIEEIDTSAYLEKAIDLALKKKKILESEKNLQIKKVKIFRYLLQKGFDTETVYKCLAQLTALKNEQ